MSKKILIVGGVAGGASTAARLRRLNEENEIIMFEKGEYISFANCGLPYYIGGEIKSRDALLLQTVEGMSKKFNMDIRNFSEVININRPEKCVTVKNLKTNETYTESYDTLILSPGASPIKPNIPGIDKCNNLFTLRNIPDTDKIKNFANDTNPKTAIIIGGGFIGLEMAENLSNKGIKVTLVEMSNQVMAPLDFEMASIVHNHLREFGINLILEDGVNSFKNNGKTVILNSGKEINTDLIILSIGVKPESEIAKNAGLKLNERGAIIVNKYLQTNDENIYALGDAIEVIDYINKKPTMIPLAWPANRQGRVLADTLCGKRTPYNGTLGSSVAKIFDLTVASTGNNEKTLKKHNIEYKTCHIHPSSHASYYPGSFIINLKLIFNSKTGKILGAQAVGADGVEKRIDVIATAIKSDLTVFDLQDLELCYAPPYSSAKDPVNMAGYVASNIIEGYVDTIQWHEIDALVKEKSFFLDVSEKEEFDLGHIDNAINIPLGTLRDNLSSLSKDKLIYVYCAAGLRGYIASRILTLNGFKCKNIDGGYRTYKNSKPIVQHHSSYENNDNKGESIVKNNNETIITLDTCGLQCPGPIRKVYEEMSKLKDGDILKITSTDAGFKNDISSWCKNTGNTLIENTRDNNKKMYITKIMKGENKSLENKPNLCSDSTEKDGATMVVFSGDLDKAIASFIIATGAASMGKQVTMFFTFWGLNVLKKKSKPSVSKNTIEKMFDVMLPSNTDKLPLSKMNMAGMGPKMIKHIMDKNNVDSLDTLITNAKKMGVKLVACTMSMELMGIKHEELIPGVDLGGVASYLGATEDSGLNLFI